MGTFERYLSLWVGLAIAAGVGLGLAAPGVFEAVAGLEVAGVNLVVAALIWVMIYPMMLKVEPRCLKDVGKRPGGIVLTLFSEVEGIPAGSILMVYSCAGTHVPPPRAAELSQGEPAHPEGGF